MGTLLLLTTTSERRREERREARWQDTQLEYPVLSLEDTFHQPPSPELAIFSTLNPSLKCLSFPLPPLPSGGNSHSPTLTTNSLRTTILAGKRKIEGRNEGKLVISECSYYRIRSNGRSSARLHRGNNIPIGRIDFNKHSMRPNGEFFPVFVTLRTV